MQTVLSLHINQIEPYYDQPRQEFDEERLQELASSIGLLGQQDPVKVRQTCKDKYQLIDGERRWRAIKDILKRNRISAIVVGVGDDDDHYVRAVAANAARESLSPSEVARAVAKIAAMPQYRELPQEEGLKRLAAIFGHSKQWILDSMKIAELPAEAQQLMDAKELPRTAALELTMISDRTRQVAVAKRVAESGIRKQDRSRAIRTAAQVEGSRAAATEPPKTARGCLPDAQIIGSIVARIRENAEAARDMPVSRLQAAYGARPMERRLAIERIDIAIRALQALKLGIERVG